MGIPPGVPVKAPKFIGPCHSYCRADCPRYTTASTPSAGMPGRAGGVAPGGRTATHTESALCLRRTCSGRRMMQTGQSPAFVEGRVSDGSAPTAVVGENLQAELNVEY